MPKKRNNTTGHLYALDKDYDKYGTIQTKDKQRTQVKEFHFVLMRYLFMEKNGLYYTEPGDRERKSLLVRFR